MKKLIASTLVVSSVVLPVVTAGNPTEAASLKEIDRAVVEAEYASKILRLAISIDGTGDGITRPYKEFNAAKNAYNTAKKLVNSLKSREKDYYAARLVEPKTQIDRAINYIDAISAGKEIEKKRLYLEEQIISGVLSEKTEEAFHNMSYEIKKQAALLDKVYGRTTREFIREYYKESAEALRDDLSYAITVKMSLDRVESEASSSKNKLKEGKKVMSYLGIVPQDNYRKQLADRWGSIQKMMPVELLDEEYQLLYSISTSMVELRGIIEPGVSSSRVPGLQADIVEKSSKLSNESLKELIDVVVQQELASLQLSVQEIKSLLVQRANEKGIPPEIVKAIAITENGYLKQFTSTGDVFKSSDNGYGVMQVTPTSESDTRFEWEKVKYNVNDNIDIGLDILLEKWNYSGIRIPVINQGDKLILENWYFAIMAYNGMSKINDPSYSSLTYQQKVFGAMKQYAQVEPEVLRENQLKINYHANGIMDFSEKMSYETTNKTKSTQLFKQGEKVILSVQANFRTSADTAGNNLIEKLAPGTKITIVGKPTEDNNRFNLFTWYKVKVDQTGKEGYIASVSLK
jgi:hypothetical protein